MCKAAKGAISYRRIFLINMIEILMDYLDKHIANSVQGSYKEWSHRFIRLKVAILVKTKGTTRMVQDKGLNTYILSHFPKNIEPII